jgi:hypothetical protein
MYAYIFQALLAFRFINQILYAFSFSPIRATCPAHLVLLENITRKLFGRNMSLIYDNNKPVVIKMEQTNEFLKFDPDELYVLFHF